MSIAAMKMKVLNSHERMRMKMISTSTTRISTKLKTPHKILEFNQWSNRRSRTLLNRDKPCQSWPRACSCLATRVNSKDWRNLGYKRWH